MALENIIIDKVTTHSASKVKNFDASAPMEIGMSAGIDGEEAFEEGYGKTSELAVQAVYQGTEEGVPVQKILQQRHRIKKGASRAGKGQWSKTGRKKGGKVQERWQG